MRRSRFTEIQIINRLQETAGCQETFVVARVVPIRDLILYTMRAIHHHDRQCAQPLDGGSLPHVDASNE